MKSEAGRLHDAALPPASIGRTHRQAQHPPLNCPAVNVQQRGHFTERKAFEALGQRVYQLKGTIEIAHSLGHVPSFNM